MISLVGRERELNELTRLLVHARLITLTGAGGVGKTRLARAVAEELAETFADGMVFVDLAPVSGPDELLPAIARTFGVREDGETTLMQRLQNALADREVLLILDNFEQILESAPLVTELLHAAPRSSILVTSRAPLRVRGEREFPLDPLACPDPSLSEPAGTLADYPAVELFIERARDVRPDFNIEDANATAIAAICRRLDGLPLALELAAARIRVLPPQAMLDRLNNVLALLTDGPRDAPDRQRTIRATVAWSYELLNQAEKDLFRRLSVFPGNFSLEAANAISGTSAHSVLDRLTSLVEKNLLRHEQASHNQPRFRMLETVREFGREQLEAAGEREHVNRAHAGYFVRLVEQSAAHLFRSERERWMQTIDVEMDNLRAVAEWSHAASDGGDALVRIVWSLGFVYWRIRGHLREGLRWCELALSAPVAQAPSPRRARLLWVAGGLASYAGTLAVGRAWLQEALCLPPGSVTDLDRAYSLVLLGFAENRLGERAASAHLREGIALARAAGERHDVLLALAIAISEFGDHDEAWATFDECASIASELGDDWLLGVALDSAGYLAVMEENWSAGRQHMQQALAIFRRLGDEGSIAIICNNLGVVAREQGDDARAAEFFQQSVEIDRRLGLNDAITLCHLGDLALRHDDISRATIHLASALRSASRGGASYPVLVSLCRLARLALAVNQPAMAARLVGAAGALRDVRSTRQAIQRELHRTAQKAQSALGEATFRAATVAGAELPLARVTAEALAWLDSLESNAGQPATDQIKHATPAVLSTRELEVLRLIARGSSNREIAAALVISLNTVARHVSNIFDKIGAANRTEAAAYAHRYGLVPQSP